jgi:hypothetical protein
MGVGVGIGLPVVILATVALLLFFEMRRQPELIEVHEEEGTVIEEVKEPTAAVQELETPTTELQAGVDSVELPRWATHVQRRDVFCFITDANFGVRALFSFNSCVWK